MHTSSGVWLKSHALLRGHPSGSGGLNRIGVRPPRRSARLLQRDLRLRPGRVGEGRRRCAGAPACPFIEEKGPRENTPEPCRRLPAPHLFARRAMAHPPFQIHPSSAAMAYTIASFRRRGRNSRASATATPGTQADAADKRFFWCIIECRIGRNPLLPEQPERSCVRLLPIFRAHRIDSNRSHFASAKICMTMYRPLAIIGVEPQHLLVESDCLVFIPGSPEEFCKCKQGLM